MSMLVGVVAYVGIFLVLGFCVSWATRRTARALGISDFQWFDVPREGDRVRLALARFASCLAPLVISALCMFVSSVGLGVPSPTSGTRVSVLEGPAREAGLIDGDRITRVAGTPVANFEALRQAVSKQAEPTPIEIERDGSQRVLSVTPRDGRIGVSLLTERTRVGLVEGASIAALFPFRVLGGYASGIASTLRGHQRAELQGPVGIVKALGDQNAGAAAFMSFLATLVAASFPFVICVHLFDVATAVVFRLSHPPAPHLDRAALRVARRYQALVIALVDSVAFMLAGMLVVVSQPLGLALMSIFCPALLSVYPLLWLAASSAWGRTKALLLAPFGLLVPCVLQGVGIYLLSRQRAYLAQAGFELGIWHASPPEAPLTPRSE